MWCRSRSASDSSPKSVDAPFRFGEDRKNAGRSGSRMIRHYYTEWYAPGVGLVKARTAVDDGGRRIDVLAADLASVEPPPNE